MQTVLTIALPFFALIFAGFAAGHFQVLNQAAIKGINSFVFYFALPSLLFLKMSAIPVIELFDWRFVAAYSGGGLISYFLCMLLGRLLFGNRLAENALQGMGAAFPNVGYLGLPLLLSIYGDRATLPAVLVIIFDHLINLTLTTALIEADQGKRRSVLGIFRTVIVGLSKNPLIVATTAGVIWGQIHWQLPAPVGVFFTLMGNAAGPCALFALGATLVGRPISDNFGEVALISGCKLLLHPLATGLIAYEFLVMDPTLAAIAVIDAALPIAANVFIISNAYGIYVARTSTAILVSTIGSMFTVSILIVALGPTDSKPAAGHLTIEQPAR